MKYRDAILGFIAGATTTYLIMDSKDNNIYTVYKLVVIGLIIVYILASKNKK